MSWSLVEAAPRAIMWLWEKIAGAIEHAGAALVNSWKAVAFAGAGAVSLATVGLHNYVVSSVVGMLSTTSNFSATIAGFQHPTLVAFANSILPLEETILTLIMIVEFAIAALVVKMIEAFINRLRESIGALAKAGLGGV